MQTQNASHDLTVTFLLKSDTYPGQPEVKAIETHMSWIFLAGHFAYKMKKTMAYDHLDYRMLEARHHFCEEELRLNRRFSTNVYLELVPVTAGVHGQLSLYGAGKTVEWLIKMRRLPADRMLDYRLRHYPVLPKEIRKVTELLSRFYLRCTPADISAAQYRQQLMQNIDDTEHALMQFPTLLSQENVRHIGARLRAMVQWQAARGLAGELRDTISLHIASTVKQWEDSELVRELELSVGSDLQFIRINGTLVGGLIAVCGIGKPSGCLNKATTANQSASAPIIAASANAATQPHSPRPCCDLANMNSKVTPASKAVANRFILVNFCCLLSGFIDFISVCVSVVRTRILLYEAGNFRWLPRQGGRL